MLELEEGCMNRSGMLGTATMSADARCAFFEVLPLMKEAPRLATLALLPLRPSVAEPMVESAAPLLPKDVDEGLEPDA